MCACSMSMPWTPIAADGSEGQVGVVFVDDVHYNGIYFQ